MTPTELSELIKLAISTINMFFISITPVHTTPKQPELIAPQASYSTAKIVFTNTSGHSTGQRK